MATFKSIISNVVKPFTSNPIVVEPTENLSPSDAVAAFKALDFVEKQIDARKKALRTLLLGWVENRDVNEVKLTKTGSQIATLAGFSVTREKRRANEPTADGIKELLIKAELSLSEAFDEIKVLQLNPSKLSFLVETGKIAKKDVEALHAITWALKVREPKDAKELLDSAKAPATSALAEDA